MPHLYSFVMVMVCEQTKIKINIENHYTSIGIESKSCQSILGNLGFYLGIEVKTLSWYTYAALFFDVVCMVFSSNMYQILLYQFCQKKNSVVSVLFMLMYSINLFSNPYVLFIFLNGYTLNYTLI